MGQSPTNFYYTDSDYDVTSERLWREATVYILSLATAGDKKLPYFLFISLHPNVALHYFSMQICSISGQIF